jgi:hypothetical protein
MRWASHAALWGREERVQKFGGKAIRKETNKNK